MTKDNDNSKNENKPSDTPSDPARLPRIIVSKESKKPQGKAEKNKKTE